MASTPVVDFPAFRQHTRAREDANTAIMGLLVGSQMAAHFLTLTDGSDHLLPSIFPGVPHVGRFNLTSKAARDILVRADQHLGTMAVPYALSIHEDLMRSCIDLAGGVAPQSAKYLHSTLAAKTGGQFDVDSLTQFHVLREMRNAVIHSGGVIDQRVVKCAADMSPAAVGNWKRIVGRSPCTLSAGARIEFSTGELFLSLAATKNLARQANRMLIPALSVHRWCELIVDDFIANGPTTGNPGQRRGKLLGWARFHYRSTGVAEEQLVAVGTARGLRCSRRHGYASHDGHVYPGTRNEGDPGIESRPWQGRCSSSQSPRFYAKGRPSGRPFPSDAPGRHRGLAKSA